MKILLIAWTLALLALFGPSVLAQGTLTVLGTGPGQNNNGFLIGGDLTDPENDIIATTQGGANFNWFASAASDSNRFTGQGALEIFDNKVGDGDKWCCSGPGVQLTLQFPAAVSLTHFTITSAEDSPQRDPVDWQISGSNNGVNFTPIFTQTTAGNTSIWGANRQRTIRVDLTNASPFYTYIRYEVTRTVGNQQHQLAELEYFGTAQNPDPDGDGLLSTWETQYGLNPNNADSNGNGLPDGQEDGDADGSNNLAEQARGTNPTDADTDDDGLLDGVETKTGIYVGISDTGTDPLDSDSDDDTFLDGIETPTEPYLDATQPGTDPNKSDTDGDFFNDSYEVTRGSDPKNPNITPGGIRLTVLGTGAGALLGGDLTDPENDIVDSTSAGSSFNWFAVTSSSQALFGGQRALEVFDNKLGGDKWCCNQTPQKLTVQFPGDVRLTHFTLTSSEDSPQRDPLDWEISGSGDGVTFTPIFTWSDPGSDALWSGRDQVLRFDLSAPSPPYRFIRYEATRCGGPFHALGEIEYFGSITTGDSDGDGLLNPWEITYGLNPNNPDTDGDSIRDGLEDGDGDLLNNLGEQARGTNPTLADTDADGYNDNVETDTGVFVSATNTGTDPLVADTDGDGLPDGVENPLLPYTGPTQTGANPHLHDTDGDGFVDGLEVNQGSNPNNDQSTPGVVRLRVLGTGTTALIGGDLTDPENDIDDTTTEGTNFNWISSEATSENNFGGQGALDIFDNKVGGGGDKWCCNGPPQQVTVQFAEPKSLLFFTIASSDDSAKRDPVDWQISGSNDGVDFTPIFTWTDAGVNTLWTARDQVLRINLPQAAPLYAYLRYEATRTGNNPDGQPSNEHALGEIEYFDRDPVNVANGLRVIDFASNPAATAFSIRWASTPGKTYRLVYATNLSGWPTVIEASLPAAAGESSTLHSFANPLPGAPRVFFRIEENP